MKIELLRFFVKQTKRLLTFKKILNKIANLLFKLMKAVDENYQHAWNTEKGSICI